MEKGKTFAYIIMSGIIVEGMRELENHHLTSIMIQIESGNNHHWKLNLRGIFDQEQDIFMVLESVSPQIVYLVARKTKNYNCTVKKLSNILIV